ncbi:phylloplanin-like [Curcuma longa]|uniref:phylloplanin-like n=1 Tax=Curcuma longa TaxID=136217 RepID=UPI003D9DF4FB
MALKIALVAALLMASAIAPPAASQLVNVNVNVNVMVSGTVPCGISGAVNTTLATPVFANATVVLRCGPDVVVNTTVTNNNGAFVFMLAVNLTVPELLRTCRLVVPTPLSVCNSSLPSNGMQAPLQLLPGSVNHGGIFGVVTNLVPSDFPVGAVRSKNDVRNDAMKAYLSIYLSIYLSTVLE